MTEHTDDATADAVAEDQPHEPHIQILRGEPTVEEVAALVRCWVAPAARPSPNRPSGPVGASPSTGCDSR